jgi:hypothetical protein
VLTHHFYTVRRNCSGNGEAPSSLHPERVGICMLVKERFVT